MSGVAVTGGTGVEEGRSARKRRAILDAARDLFLRGGYEGTSMDDVAARAAVSKQTVYKHFADKRSLFTELIAGDVGLIEAPVHPLVAGMPDTDDVARDLRAYARLHLADVMQPHLLRMRRVLIGEAERFPELARTWYAAGPERSCALFAGWFRALDRRGLLRVDDPLLAAQHFNWLVLSIPLNKAMAYPQDARDAQDAPLFTQHELDRFADEAVRVFLAAYGPPPAAPAP